MSIESKLDDIKNRLTSGNVRIGFGTLTWLGGAIHTMNQPGCGFWDGVVWMYYVGRFIAVHFTAL